VHKCAWPVLLAGIVVAAEMREPDTGGGGNRAVVDFCC